MKSVRALSFFLFIIAVLVLGPNAFASADSGGSKAREALNMEVISHNVICGDITEKGFWLYGDIIGVWAGFNSI